MGVDCSTMGRMTAHSPRPRAKISVSVERPILARVAQVQAAERRTQSATVELLVLEALTARGAAPETVQGATDRPVRGGEPAAAAHCDALSGTQGATS